MIVKGGVSDPKYLRPKIPSDPSLFDPSPPTLTPRTLPPPTLILRP